MQEVDKKEGYRSILEMGPLLLFFGVNYFYGIMAGTAVLVISTLLSLILSWYWFKNITMMAKDSHNAMLKFRATSASSVWYHGHVNLRPIY